MHARLERTRTRSPLKHRTGAHMGTPVVLRDMNNMIKGCVVATSGLYKHRGLTLRRQVLQGRGIQDRGGVATQRRDRAVVRCEWMEVKACMPWPWWRERNSSRGVALVMQFAASIGHSNAAYGSIRLLCVRMSSVERRDQVWLVPLPRYITCTHKLDLHASAGAHTVKSGVTCLLMQP